MNKYQLMVSIGVYHYFGFSYSGFFFSTSFKTDELLVFTATATLSIIAIALLVFSPVKNKLYLYFLSLFLSMIFYFYIQDGFDYLTKFISIIDFSMDKNISVTESSISKIIMGYLIYHFIVSIRKDTRK